MQPSTERVHDGDHAGGVLENPWLDAEAEAGGRHETDATIRLQPPDDRSQPRTSRWNQGVEDLAPPLRAILALRRLLGVQFQSELEALRRG
jgi:hypothetical protein